MAPLLIVFAKAPLQGQVKTRLTPVLSPERACQLHSAMVADLLSRLQDLRPTVDLELHTDVVTAEWQQGGLSQDLQSPGNLGQRMYFALNRALAAGRPAVLLLGSDSPTVPLSHLLELLESEVEMALGPATDGGFYAICCKRADPNMFDRITWSAATTCQETLAAAQRCGLKVALGPPWYDVDCPADLPLLLADPNLGPATRAALERNTRRTRHVGS